MALDLRAQYPLQVNTSDPDYPFGKAQNETIEGDGTGTPWEQQIVNEQLGFQQALLALVGATPNGTPERSNASQYATAIQTLISQATNPLDTRISGIESIVARPGLFTIASQVGSHNNSLVLTEAYDLQHNYSLDTANSHIYVTNVGYYWVTATLNFSSIGSSGVPRTIGVRLALAGTVLFDVQDTATLDQTLRTLSLRTLVRIPDPVASFGINVRPLIQIPANGLATITGQVTIEPVA